MKVFLAAIFSVLVACGGGNPEPVPTGNADSPESGTITVTVTNVGSAQGRVGFSLYATEDGFPGERAKAEENMVVDAQSGAVTIEFEDIDPGEYAVSVLHDENNSGDMDTGAFGIPAEGWGVSRNPEPGFGPPAWSDAVFVHNGDIELEIRLNY